MNSYKFVKKEIIYAVKNGYPEFEFSQIENENPKCIICEKLASDLRTRVGIRL